MPNHADAQILQMLQRQVGQDLLADLILAECRLILFEAKPPQPTSDVMAAPRFAQRYMFPGRDSLSRGMTGNGMVRPCSCSTSKSSR